MRPYHIACNSTNLSTVKINKGHRTIIFDKCEYCNRIIESHEINSSRILFYKAISNIKSRPQSGDMAKMIIRSYKN
jgi:hypothetical protein